MAISNIGNYDFPSDQRAGEYIKTAGRPTTFAPRRGKFIPPARVEEQRREAVGVGERGCFYHGAPAMAPKTQYQKQGKAQTDHVIRSNVGGNPMKSMYQEDYSAQSAAFSRHKFEEMNSFDAAFGKVPHGGFVKFHDVETRSNTGSIPEEKYKMVYSQKHILGAVQEAVEGQSKSKPTRRPVCYDSHVSLGKARDRANMRTLNFCELPGQELNPKPMRKDHPEYGGRHKASQITWAYHG